MDNLEIRKIETQSELLDELKIDSIDRIKEVSIQERLSVLIKSGRISDDLLKELELMKAVPNIAKQPDINVEDGKIEIWNRVLRSVLSLPGAYVNRAAYLKKELSKQFTEEMVQKAIETTPAKAGIPSSAIRSIAQSSIAWHRAGVSATSFTVGLPGGWWMAGTIPADLAQFFWHVAVILQKLAYLHGWPELFEKDSEPDDETLLIFSIFIGVMFGAGTASKLLGDLAERVGKQVLNRLPKQALTQWGIYNLSKQIAKWIGIRLTKQSFARILAKAIPVVSGFISGTVTWVSFSLMSRRLRKHLETLRPHLG